MFFYLFDLFVLILVLKKVVAKERGGFLRMSCYAMSCRQIRLTRRCVCGLDIQRVSLLSL